MTELKELREIFEEVKELLIEGYRQKGKEDNAKLIEQIDVGALADFVIPLVEAELQKGNIDIVEVASL